jgi:hypothetical protein
VTRQKQHGGKAWQWKAAHLIAARNRERERERERKWDLGQGIPFEGTSPVTYLL